MLQEPQRSRKGALAVTPWQDRTQTQRDEMCRDVRQEVMAILRKGPITLGEIRAALDPQNASALLSVLTLMVNAGEVASLGHSVYTLVPWCQAAKPVAAEPLTDLVFNAVALYRKASQIIAWLGLPEPTVRGTLEALRDTGFVHYNWKSDDYTITRPAVARLIRKGASERVFVDLAVPPRCEDENELGGYPCAERA